MMMTHGIILEIIIQKTISPQNILFRLKMLIDSQNIIGQSCMRMMMKELFYIITQKLLIPVCSRWISNKKEEPWVALTVKGHFLVLLNWKEMNQIHQMHFSEQDLVTLTESIIFIMVILEVIQSMSFHLSNNHVHLLWYQTKY